VWLISFFFCAVPVEVVVPGPGGVRVRRSGLHHLQASPPAILLRVRVPPSRHSRLAWLTQPFLFVFTITIVLLFRSVGSWYWMWYVSFSLDSAAQHLLLLSNADLVRTQDL
jgi:hypothetical protein